MSDFAIEAAQAERAAALGAPVLEPLDLLPLPWKHALGGPVLTVLGLASAVGAVFARPSSIELAGALAIGALALFGGAAVAFARRIGQLGRLELFQGGISLTRGRTKHLVPFAEADDLRLVERDVLNNGNFGGVRRLVTVRSPAGELTFRHFSAVGTTDTLAPRLALLFDKLADAADSSRKASRPLRGDGWSLDATQLALGGRAVPIAELKAVALFDGRVSIWKGTEDDPFFGARVDGKNALLLRIILDRTLSPAPESEGELGRVLFRKQPGRLLPGLLGAIGVPCGVAAFFLVTSRDPVDFMPGVWCSLGSAALLAIAAWLWTTSFRARERGVERRTLFGLRTLRYDELESFQYSATRHYHNGAYTGTHLVLAFVGTGGRKLRFFTVISKSASDEDLDALRQMVTQRLQARFLREVLAGGELRWGPDARLTQSTLEFTESRIFGKGPARSLALSSDFSATLSEGKLHFVLPGAAKAALVIRCDAPNFYPGLAVFEQLTARARNP